MYNLLDFTRLKHALIISFYSNFEIKMIKHQYLTALVENKIILMFIHMNLNIKYIYIIKVKTNLKHL